MKKTLFLMAAALIAITSCTPTGEYNISGTIAGTDTGMVYMKKTDSTGAQVILDSSVISKGSFSFAGKTDMPEMRILALRNTDLTFPFFLENGRIKVQLNSDSVALSTVTGSASNDLYRSFSDSMMKINEEMNAIYKMYMEAAKAGDSAGMAKQDTLYAHAEKKQKEQITSFAKNNGKSVVAPYVIMRNSYQYELPELEEIVTSFDTSINGSYYTRNLQKRVAILKSVAIGQPAPQFTLNDTTGNPFSLSSLKGKYVLVDFWASWCSPCRAENPNVVAAYNAYKAKDFTVLGVSFDVDRNKWLNAIKADQLAWNHVSDLAGWNNAAGKMYGINSIPANVLLDKDQVIIARNLRGEDLMKKLEELMGPAPIAKKAKK